MKSKVKIYIIALLLVVIVLAGIVKLAEISFSSSAAFTSKIDGYLKEINFQGVALIAREGKIVFSRGYGYANLEHQIPNTQDTVFRIGSITKLMTAVAIMQLQERGVLSVHDSIKKYIPRYPMGEKITIHHLLSHTAGIPSITEFPNLTEIQRHPSSPQQVMAYFAHLPLEFEPGTSCAYSDSGYIILGAIIEAVTKKSYEEYMQENIFEPLQMPASYYEHNDLVIPHRASGYVRSENGTLHHANYIDMSFPHASGALSSTVGDLYKLDRALKNGSLLTKESMDAIFTIHGSNSQNKIAYGYGIRLGSQNRGMEEGGSSIVGHFGTIEGFEAALIRHADHDITIILLSNLEHSPVRQLHQDLARLIDPSWRSSAGL